MTLVAPHLSTDAALRERVMTIVANSGAEVAVAFSTLDGRDELLLDPDKSFHAASTMKVPIMIELFRQAQAGQLSLDDPLPIRNEFHSIVDGSVYQLDVGDDSDAEVYKAVGGTLSLRQLCEAMITVSSNFAANLLIERLGVDNIKATVTRLGADGMRVLRGVEDNKAFEKGLNNTTTARGAADPVAEVATGQAVSDKADAEMVAILKRQQFNNAIPAGLPAGWSSLTRPATSRRSITTPRSSSGRGRTCWSFSCGGLPTKVSAQLIASISREVWAAVAR